MGNDLVQGCGVDAYSFLFEATTVLGRSPQDIVRQAWDFGRLHEIHTVYIDTFTENLSRLEEKSFSPSEILGLASEEAAAYRAAMVEDPLLPDSLWPSDYRGPEVYALHQHCIQAIAARL